MGHLVSGVSLMSRRRNSYATASELGAERGSGLDRGSVGDRNFGTGGSIGADRRIGDWLYQCDDWSTAQDHYVPADAGHAWIVLVCDQRADAGASFGAVVAGIRGAWISCGVCGCDRAQPG